ncbi:MAG: hypothetical protein HYX86_01105 [Chloroflexi bacterium]|nr:hypothetical protein [Chloroflexota bacterium]
MEQALRLYRDVLGFEVVGDPDPIWTVIKSGEGELTLHRVEKVVPLVLRDGEDTPIMLHVSNFEQAADQLEGQGYQVKRKSSHAGILADPWGNLIGLHDHRKG